MNKTIYSFDVTDKLKEGKNVYVVDMTGRAVYLVNEMDAETFVKLINSDNSDYIFYTNVEEDE